MRDTIIFHLKAIILKNKIKSIPKEHSLLKILFVGILSSLLLLSIFFLIYKGCIFIKAFPFGELLIERGLFLFFLTIFSLIIFSSLVAGLSTLYISKEVLLLRSLPIPISSIFNIKFQEATILSSWAPIIFSIPIVFGYGMAMRSPFLIYPFAILAIPLLTLISSTIGTGLLLILSLFFPIKRGYILTLGLFLLSIPLFLFCLKFGIFKEISDKPFEFFGRLIEGMAFSTHPLLPSSWFVKGLKLVEEKSREAIFYFFVLLTNALFLFTLTNSLALLFYLKGMERIESSGSHSKKMNLFRLIRGAFFFLPKRIKALCAKDITIFLRDPMQIAQFLIFFGIMFIYILNLPRTPYQIDLLYWKFLILFLNIAALSLITSTLTTRFVFPLISLEGKRFWVLMTSPLTKKALVIEKLILNTFIFLVITEILMLFLNKILKTEPYISFLSLIMIGIMSIVLVSLSVCLGAIYPDFKKENSASIVSGLGGTINAIISLFYCLSSILIIAIPASSYALNRLSLLMIIKRLSEEIWFFLLFSLLVFFVPLILGIKRLEKVEV
ncbi:MAG: hypothetical protein AB1297_01085 [bacterium]